MNVSTKTGYVKQKGKANQRGLLKKTVFGFDRCSRTALPYLLRVVWPMALNQVLWYASFFALFATASALPHGSVQAMAGMSAGMRIESILHLPAFALGLTSSLITGSSLHTLNVYQLRRMTYKIMVLGLGEICLPAALLWFAAGPLSGLMTTDAQTAAEAASFLRFSLCAMPFLVVYMTLSVAMAGAGATLYQLPAMAGSAWLVRIPLAWYLGHVYMKESTGIWWAILISLIIQALFMRLKRTSSKRKRVSHVRPEAGLETPSKAGGRNSIFISTEPGGHSSVHQGCHQISVGF